MSDNGSVKHYRALIGGGAVAYVRDGQNWVWRFRPGGDPSCGHHDDHNHFSSPEAFAKYMGHEIDVEEHQQYLIRNRPVPRRREAVMATRKLL